MPGAAATLHTRTWGRGASRALLLHGISSSADGWWRVGDDLARRGWTAVAADLRGHGHSPSGDDYRLSSYAEDVLALGGGWDVVVGHSLGGAVAVLAAAGRPGWAGGLVLQDPTLVMPDAARPEILRTLMEPYDRPATPAAVAAGHPGWHEEDCRVKAEALRRSSPEVVRATFDDNLPWNVLAEAASPPCPAVVLGSDPREGGVLAVTIGEWLGSQEGVEYRMLEGAGHSAHRDAGRYDGYLATLLAAFERLRSMEVTA